MTKTIEKEEYKYNQNYVSIPWELFADEYVPDDSDWDYYCNFYY